jgi:small conductance mechanosensitive channel
MKNWIDNFRESFSHLKDKLASWVNEIIVLIPNLILAAIVLGIGIFLSRYVNRYVGKTISRFSNHRAVNRLVSSVITTIFVLLIIFIVLSILKLDTALQSLLAGAGVAGLAIGLALQDPIINLFSGVMMSTKRSFNLGDVVETNDYFGCISNINLRSTILRTNDGQDVVIPNKNVYQNPLKNYTSSNERRVVVNCGVSYGDDLEKAKSIAIEAIKNAVETKEDHSIELFFTAFGDSSINFVIHFWIADYHQKAYLAAKSQAIIAIKKAFDEHEITIPFPIRTLDFGVPGGVELAAALPASLNGQMTE